MARLVSRSFELEVTLPAGSRSVIITSRSKLESIEMETNTKIIFHKNGRECLPAPTESFVSSALWCR